MTKYVELGYPIYEGMPVHPVLPQVKIEPRERLEKGDPWNGSVLSMYLHAGTHVDAPWHHLDDGKGIDEIPIEDFIYKNPLLIDCPLGKNGYITMDHLNKYKDSLYDADILFFNTGYWKLRSQDIEKYANDFPALSTDAAKYIRTELPNCKAVAIDTLSIENLDDAADNGYFVHHAFLDHKQYDTPTMLIYEDVNYEPVENEKIKSAFAVPLRLKGYDASVINIVAEVEKK